MTNDKDFQNHFIRLSDRILFALEKSIEQQDLPISDLLARALDLSMTRNAGGGEFIERRDYPTQIESTMTQLSLLRKSKLKS